MSNNISTIKKFLLDKQEKNLFFNQVDEKIDQFYYFIINHYSEQLNLDLKIANDENTHLFQTDDLFGKPKVVVYKKIPIKKIDILLKSSEKKIFFMEYRTFKKFKDQFSSVNAYNYKLDIKSFLQDELKINNRLLIDNVINNPEYTYSEIHKFLVNQNYQNIIFNENIIDNFLLNRKNLYDHRNKDDLDLVKFYKSLKNEVNIKKFSFLTY